MSNHKTKSLLYLCTGFLTASLAASTVARADLIYDLTTADYSAYLANTSVGVVTPDVGPTATLVGTPTVKTGSTPNGSSTISFNGSSAFALTDVANRTNATNEYTVLAYILPTSPTGGPSTIVGAGSGSFQFRLGQNGGGTAGSDNNGSLELINALQANIGHGNTTVPTTSFDNVDVVYAPDAAVNSQTTFFYLNGNLDGTGTSTVAMSGISRVGARQDGGAGSAEFFTGQIAEVRMYDTALSTVDRQAVEQQFTAQYAGSGSVWKSATGGDFQSATNYVNGIVPNAIGAEADLMANLTASRTLYIDSAETLGTLNIINSNEYLLAGAGSLTFAAASGGTAKVIVGGGTQEINVPVTIASNLTYTVATGATLIIADPVTILPGLTVSTTGTVTYQSTVTVGKGSTFHVAGNTVIPSLALANNSVLNIAPTTGTRTLLSVSSSSISTGAQIDLTNNDLIVPGGNLAVVSAEVKSGYNAAGGANWQGTGITSSTAASDSTHRTAVGVISNNNGSGTAVFGSGTSAGLFDGTSPALNDVLVRYTYFGDANLDGTVDGSDYSLIDNGFNKHLTGWYNGDFNYDGVVDGSDYTLIDNAFNTQTGSLVSGGSLVAASTDQISGSAVPEPASFSLLGVTACGLLSRRRRSSESSVR